MADINLHMNSVSNATYVSNNFIDYYMIQADGEYVKIYLYILRALSLNPTDFSISSMADTLGHTQLDIRRALNYWEQLGLLSVRCDSMGEICDICVNDPGMGNGAYNAAPSVSVTAGSMAVSLPGNMMPAGNVPGAIVTLPADMSGVRFNYPVSQVSMPSSVPSASAIKDTVSEPLAKAPDYSASDLDSFEDNHDVKEIIFIAERYLGRTLTATDMNTLLYWYEGLNMNVDLIEHLIAHCVDLGKTSMKYMNKVALSWADDNISTVADATARSNSHSAETNLILKCMGISNRNLTPVESDYVNKWFHEWNFSQDLVAEACNRTIIAIGKPQFPYADGILKGWLNAGVSETSQLHDADIARRKKYEATPKKNTSSANRFHNYTEESYDISSIESQLLKRKY
ncbi:MAG: DnaD domain protein [Lachnospiraceae bacterium]|nr:DnaD domain protein [Lachnospiraceae bacterium]